MSRSSSQSSARTTPRSSRTLPRSLSLALLALLSAGLLTAVEVPERSAVSERIFRLPDLEISTILRLPAELPPGDVNSLAVADLAALGLPPIAAASTSAADGGASSRPASRSCRVAASATS